jgi:hypothetical protein
MPATPTAAAAAATGVKQLEGARAAKTATAHTSCKHEQDASGVAMMLAWITSPSTLGREEHNKQGSHSHNAATLHQFS